MKLKRLLAGFVVMAMTAGMMSCLVFADESENEPKETTAVETTETEAEEKKPAAKETKPAEEEKPAESKAEEPSETEGKQDEETAEPEKKAESTTVRRMPTPRQPCLTRGTFPR